MCVTVGAIVGLMASGYTKSDILAAYPYLEEKVKNSWIPYSLGDFWIYDTLLLT
jgi:uncharacterized protein (DUF433 family)